MIVEQACAKLNLALHVRARRDDGYHEIETLFVFCRDGDEIRLDPHGAPGLTIAGPMGGGLDAGADNLVSRAVIAFRRDVVDVAEPAITLVKRLPIASGIGGGSADAAATLRAMARAHDMAVDDARLMRCAVALGSDVPACLWSRPAVGWGRGEAIEPMGGVPRLPVLLVNPRVAVSTAQVFAGWDGVDRGGLDIGDPIAVARAGRNDLEAPARAVAPAIDDALALLGDQPGAILVRMSGSGATCFALFEDEPARDAASAAIWALRPDWWRLETALS